MNKYLLAATAAVALAAVASSANAALVVTLGSPGIDGSISGTFASGGLSGDFDQTTTFTLPTGLASATITSTFQGGGTDVNFTSVTLNGAPLLPGSTGVNEFRAVNNLVVSSGTQTLRVIGNSGSAGSYSGTIAFAVPEPATWALMIGGFGAAGAMLRRRREVLA